MEQEIEHTRYIILKYCKFMDNMLDDNVIKMLDVNFFNSFVKKFEQKRKTGFPEDDNDNDDTVVTVSSHSDSSLYNN